MPDLDDSWRPLEPTSSDPWDIRKVAHLHRRAGFAAGWQMLQRDVADGMEATTDRLLNTAHSEDSGVFESVASGLRRGVRQGPDHEVRLQAHDQAGFQTGMGQGQSLSAMEPRSAINHIIC